MYNVHNLVHIADDVAMFGSLDSVSCFPYENYLHQLKKKVRRPQNPLSQVIRRISEEEKLDEEVKHHDHTTFCFKREHASGPLPIGIDIEKQFRDAYCGMFLSIEKRDNCVLVSDKGQPMVALVRNIIKDSTDNASLVVQRFQSLKPFYSYPLESSMLGIFKVSSLSSSLETMSLQSSSSMRKCILVDNGESEAIVISLIHYHLK